MTDEHPDLEDIDAFWLADSRPWYSLDPAQAKRITAALDRFDARKKLEAEHARIGLRFVPPVLGGHERHQHLARHLARRGSVRPL